MNGSALDEVKVKTLKSIVVTTGLIASLLVILSGCGRKADLDPPDMPIEQQNQRTSNPKNTVEDRPFVLDRLL
ncbi:hypothetical protein SAMN05880593_106227 [Rhizobium sp. RU36D]|nr:hypothetical protein SAMN05880593_106227 [Rhizobium sp. RU36D]